MNKEFEEFLARLWSVQGYETTVTQASRDAGIDVIAETDEERIAIQAKLYRSGRVTGPEVQQYSAIQQDDAYDGVIIATTHNRYNRHYWERGNDYGVRLIKGEKLADLAKKHNNKSETSENSDVSNEIGLFSRFTSQPQHKKKIQITGILLLTYAVHLILFADLIIVQLLPWLTTGIAAIGWIFGAFIIPIMIYNHGKLEGEPRNAILWSLMSFFIPMIGPSIYLYHTLLR